MTPIFSLSCYQNEYLPEGGIRADAIVTVTATGSGAGPTGGRAAGSEVIILDVSASMEGTKLVQAGAATKAAIDCIRDGVPFGVIAGNERAVQVFPTSGLVPSTTRTRAQAAKAVARLRAHGGTAIGEWVSLAARLHSGAHPTTGGVRHAILLTDGRDEHETPAALDTALASASGLFQCDCRGVGLDWNVAELRKVASTLLGSVDIVADPSQLTTDFQSMMRGSMDRAVDDVRLRVWNPRGTEVVFLKQVAPGLNDLTGTAQGADELTTEYPTGAWGDESRDYHLAIRVPARSVGDRLLAARVSVVVNGEERATSQVRAVWTDDTSLSTRVDRHVAHFTGQEALADAVLEGLEARRRGDEETATAKLGLAVRLAAEARNAATARLLERVVEVQDWTTGQVRLKERVDRADEMTLDTRSTTTTRLRT